MGGEPGGMERCYKTLTWNNPDKGNGEGHPSDKIGALSNRPRVVGRAQMPLQGYI